MKKRYILLSWIILIGISIVVCPKGIDNTISLLLENNFFIPRESCFCTFWSTETSEGSGEGWLYGEDNKYYYGMTTNDGTEKLETTPIYFALKKGQESKNFDKLDYKTWDKAKGVNWLPKKFRWSGYTGDLEPE